MATIYYIFDSQIDKPMEWKTLKMQKIFNTKIIYLNSMKSIILFSCILKSISNVLSVSYLFCVHCSNDKFFYSYTQKNLDCGNFCVSKMFIKVCTETERLSLIFIII